MHGLRLQLQKIESQGCLILLVAREEGTNERFVLHVPFRPYFYVPEDEEASGDSAVSIDDIRVRRVVAESPMSIPKTRKAYSRTWEAAVPYTRRFLVDTGIRSGFEVDLSKCEEVAPRVLRCDVDALKPADVSAKTRVCYYDIETNKDPETKRYSPPTVASGEVTCITYEDSFSDGERVTLIWHPTMGRRGRARTELRYAFSEAHGREVPWKIIWFGTEQEMLLAWVQYLKDSRPDVLAAWNGHYGIHRKNLGGYDAPYLITRLNRREIGIGANQMSPFGVVKAGWNKLKRDRDDDSKGLWSCRIDGIQLADLMTLYSVKEGGFTANVPFHGLKPVAEKFANIKLHKDPASIEDWWMYETESFLTYSFRDVDAIVGLDQKEGYLKFGQDLMHFCGVEDLDVVFRPSTLVGTLELREAHNSGRVIPTADDSESDEDVGGGYVIEPRKWGVMSNVLTFDLNKMYVAIMQSANISYETCLGLKIDPPPGESDDRLWYSGTNGVIASIPASEAIRVPSDRGVVLFRKNERGLTPRVLDNLVKLREEFDAKIAAASTPEEKEMWKRKRGPAKSLALTAYGHMLNGFNALFRVLCGAAVTGCGRHIIQHVDSLCTNLGVQVIRGDTDSVFVLLPEGEDPVSFGKWLEGSINESFNGLARDLGIEEHNFRIEFQTLFSVFASGPEKKRYAGLVSWEEGVEAKEPMLLIKGVEGIKSDAAPITRELTGQTIRAILNRVPAKDVLSMVQTMYNAVCDGELPVREVVKSTTLNFDVDVNARRTHVTMGARNGKARFGFEYPVGQRVFVLQSAEDEWVAIPESEDIPDDLRVNWAHHAETTIIGPLKGILGWIGAKEQLNSIQRGGTPTIATPLF